MDATIHFTKFRSLDKPQGKSSRHSWDDLVELFKAPGVHRTKTDMPLFSFTKFKEDYRTKANAGMVHAVIVEHDGEYLEPEKAADIMRDSGIASIVYTTPSHSWDAPRFRLVVRLSKPTERNEHNRMVRVLNHLLDGALARESLDVEREWFYGRVEGSEYTCIAVDGAPLDEVLVLDLDGDERDLDGDAAVEDDGEAEPKRRRSDSDLDDIMGRVILPPEPPTKEAGDRIRAILKASKADPDALYVGNTGKGPICWSHVVMALHSTQHPDAKKIAIAWSKSAKRKDAFNKEKFDALWKSFDIDRDETIGLGTLIHHAKQNGWIDPNLVMDSRDEMYGDISNGNRFAKKYKDELLYIAGAGKWFKWDGVRWDECSTGEHIELAKRVAGEICDEASRARKDNDSAITKANYERALSLYNHHNKLESMIKSATSIPGMSKADRSIFDTDTMLLGVRNGVVDLETGKLIPAERDMYITKQAAAEFREDAQCPMFLRFLDEVFNGDQGVIDYVQRVMGYALTGNVSESMMFMMVGNGSNGKSVLSNIVEDIMGNYCESIRSTLLIGKKYGMDAEAERLRTKLQGVRLALLNETNSGDVFDESVMKELVSNDKIGARALYEAPFTFMPTHKIVLRTNHLPIAKATDEGFWRRICVLNFEQNFKGREDFGLQDRILAKESAGVLAWMVRGCVKWQESGGSVGNMPEKVRSDTDAYRTDSDMIGQWLKSRFTFGAKLRTLVSLIYHDYCESMAKTMGVKFPKTKPELLKSLAERGFYKKEMTAGICVFGLELKDDGVEAFADTVDDDEL